MLSISTIDLKDVLADLEGLRAHQNPTRPEAPLVGWADPMKIQQMRRGQIRCLTVSRKKGETTTHQVCAIAPRLTVDLDRAKLISKGEPA